MMMFRVSAAHETHLQWCCVVGVDRVLAVILEFLTFFGQDTSKVWETGLCPLDQFCISDVCSVNYFTLMYELGPGSSVGIATELRTGRSGNRIPVG
jgi:hypothetical protein